MDRAVSAKLGLYHCTGVQSPASIRSQGHSQAVPIASNFRSLIAVTTSRTDSAVRGNERRFTNKVGSLFSTHRREDTNRHSWMSVCSERLLFFGSWQHSTRSIWNLAARNDRSGTPDTAVSAVTGRISASTPFSRSRIFSANGVNIVRMLFASNTWPASASIERRWSRNETSLAPICFLASGPSLTARCWLELKGGFIKTVRMLSTSCSRSGPIVDSGNSFVDPCLGPVRSSSVSSSSEPTRTPPDSTAPYGMLWSRIFR